MGLVTSKLGEIKTAAVAGRMERLKWKGEGGEEDRKQGKDEKEEGERKRFRCRLQWASTCLRVLNIYGSR